MAQLPAAPAAPAVPPIKPPGKIKRFFSAIASLPKKLWGLSLATRATIVVAFVLTCIVITSWVVFFTDDQTVPWRHSMTFGRMLVIICLLIVIPIIVHRCVKLWIEGEASQFPDIDFAWKAGLTALQRNGIDLTGTPIFLILGSSSVRQERALLEASGVKLRVREVPPGPAPLHWYAGPEAIYLFCSEASWLSALNSLEENKGLADVASSLANLEAPTTLPTSDYGMPSAPEAPPAPEPNRGTIMLDAAQLAQHLPGPGGSPPGKAGNDDYRGTMMLQAPLNLERMQPSQPIAPSMRSTERRSLILPPQDSAEQLQRLQYACQLLRRARQPLCAVNGVLTLLSFEMIQSGPREAEELQRAIKGDLGAVARTLELRSPVTALVVGLEKEQGFRELVRRVGRDRAAVQRFGQRFDLRSVPTPGELAALCIHVCGAFEDWVYALFRERGALSRPGNTSLYGLLSKVRSNLKQRLSDLLVGGYGYDPQQDSYDEPILFSGCYFAATGDTEDRRAFVQGVFNKLAEEQEDVEWTQRALAHDRRYLLAAYLGFALDAVLLCALVGMIVYAFFWK